jgi:large subunit ribosomal protein L15
MKLNELPKSVERSAKIVGRGIGSGKGKTSGRGQKGQKARGKVPAFGVGGGLLLYKKLPYRRGWTRHGGNPKRAPKPIIIKTSQLQIFKAGSTINLESLVKEGLIMERQAKNKGVKILMDKPLEVSLTILVPVSNKAKELIEKAGGKVVI